MQMYLVETNATAGVATPLDLPSHRGVRRLPRDSMRIRRERRASGTIEANRYSISSRHLVLLKHGHRSPQVDRRGKGAKKTVHRTPAFSGRALWALYRIWRESFERAGPWGYTQENPAVTTGAEAVEKRR